MFNIASTAVILVKYPVQSTLPEPDGFLHGIQSLVIWNDSLI